MLQQDLCKPDVTSKFHEAGGPCSGNLTSRSRNVSESPTVAAGFTSSFCQKPFGEEFCQQRTWMPDQGSQAWLQTHKVRSLPHSLPPSLPSLPPLPLISPQVMDPGNTSGTAGENLFSSQLPQYSQVSEWPSLSCAHSLQSVADSLAKYLAAGAAEDSAESRFK